MIRTEVAENGLERFKRNAGQQSHDLFGRFAESVVAAWMDRSGKRGCLHLRSVHFPEILCAASL